jgi:hypothetical protein
VAGTSSTPDLKGGLGALQALRSIRQLALLSLEHAKQAPTQQDASAKANAGKDDVEWQLWGGARHGEPTSAMPRLLGDTRC